MGSTSFWGFSYPNLLLVFLNLLFFRNLFYIFLAASVGTLFGSYFILSLFFCTIFWVSSKVQVYKSSTSTFWKTKKTKTNIVSRNRTTVNAIVRVSIRSRNFGALRARWFIHAPSLPMGSKPWLAGACERSRCPRAPGEKALADLKKLDLDDGATFV